MFGPKALTLESLIHDWNASLGARNKVIDEWNEEIRAKYQNGEILPETALDSLEPQRKPLAVPSSSWVRSWKAAWGWSMLSRGGDEQAWLAYSSSDMINARQGVRDQFAKAGVHPFLMLNYDQLWRQNFTTGNLRLSYKHRKNVGRKANKQRVTMKIDKKIHAIKGGRHSMTVSCF